MATQSRLGRGQLRPIASPVDRFERTDEGGKLAQVADALGRISPEVQQLSDTLFTQHVEDETEAGKAAADEAWMQTGARTEREALAKGMIQPGQSKTFMRTFRQSLAQHRALADGRALAEFAEAELGEETDMEVVQQKLGEFRAQRMEEAAGESEDFTAAYNAQYLAVEQNTLLNLSYRIGANQKKALERSVGAILSEGIDIELGRQPVEGETLAPITERLRGVFASQRQRLYDTGITGERANRVVMQAVVDKAISDGEPQLIDALLMTPTGSGGSATFGSTPALSVELRQAYNSARSVRRMRDEDERWANDRAAEDILQRMQADLLEHREAGRNLSLFDTAPYEAALNKLGPEYGARAREEASGMARAASVQRSSLADEHMIPLIYDRNLSVSQLRAMRENGDFTVDDYVRYRDMIQRRDSSAFTWSRRNQGNESYNQSWVGTVYRWHESKVNDAVDGVFFAAPEIARKYKADISIKLRYEFEEWLYDNPTATREEATKAAADIARRLIDEGVPKPGGQFNGPNPLLNNGGSSPNPADLQ